MMSTIADNVIDASFDNSPLMLDKSQYNSWQCHMLLYIKEKIREAYDIRATNIVLQGLQLDVYSLVNHHTVAKEIWDRVKLLIEGSELSLQERESKLQHEAHINEVRMMRQRFLDPLALVANSYNSPPVHNYHQSYLVVSKFIPTDDPIQSLNKAMSFLNDILTLINNPQTNNQNEQNQQTQTDAGDVARGNAIGTWVIQNTRNATANQSKVIRCYNYRGEGHIARQYEEKIAFLQNKGEKVDSNPAAQALTTNVIFQTDDVLSEVPNYNTYHDNTVFEQNVQEMQYSKQTIIDDASNIKITSDNNVISYDQYLKESENEVVQSIASPDQQNAMIMSVIEKMSSQVAKCNVVNLENKTINESLIAELERYKEQVIFFEERQKIELTKREKYIDSQMRDIVCIAMHSHDDNDKYASMEKSYVEAYNQCLELEVVLVKKKDMIEHDVFIELSKSYSKLEKHCFSLEIVVQQSKENFQKEKPCEN
ncbi:hypothetical protein Tco_0009969 [Tanacetum coccineum]